MWSWHTYSTPPPPLPRFSSPVSPPPPFSASYYRAHFKKQSVFAPIHPAVRTTRLPGSLFGVPAGDGSPVMEGGFDRAGEMAGLLKQVVWWHCIGWRPRKQQKRDHVIMVISLWCFFNPLFFPLHWTPGWCSARGPEHTRDSSRLSPSVPPLSSPPPSRTRRHESHGAIGRMGLGGRQEGCRDDSDTLRALADLSN